MTVRKNISLLLIMLLLGAQLALAQHATVHFTDHGGIHHQHDNDSPQVNELCQLCIFAKGFAHGLSPDDAVLHADFLISSYRVPVAHNYLKRQESQGYLSRGPPAFLS